MTNNICSHCQGYIDPDFKEYPGRRRSARIICDPCWKGIPLVSYYYSHEALEMDHWAREETNRLKASRIFNVAQCLEHRYRDSHKDKINNLYTRSAAILICPKKSVVSYK